MSRFLLDDITALTALERGYFDDFHAVNPDSSPIETDRKIRRSPDPTGNFLVACVRSRG